jgi:hypothetical protein
MLPFVVSTNKSQTAQFARLRLRQIYTDAASRCKRVPKRKTFMPQKPVRPSTTLQLLKLG